MHDKIRTESQLVRFTALLKKSPKIKKTCFNNFFLLILLPSSLLVDTQLQRPTGQTRESWQYYWMSWQKWNSRGIETERPAPTPQTKLKLRRVVWVVRALIKVQCSWEMLICATSWEESQHEQKKHNKLAKEAASGHGAACCDAEKEGRKEKERRAIWICHTAGRQRMLEEAAESLRGNTAAAGWLVCCKRAGTLLGFFGGIITWRKIEISKALSLS